MQIITKAEQLAAGLIKKGDLIHFTYLDGSVNTEETLRVTSFDFSSNSWLRARHTITNVRHDFQDGEFSIVKNPEIIKTTEK